MSRASGHVEFRDPHGRPLDACPKPAPVNDWWMALDEWTEGKIDEDTNFPAWDGTPVDYDATLSALWECRQ